MLTSELVLLILIIGIIIGAFIVMITTNNRISDYQEHISKLHDIILNKKK